MCIIQNTYQICLFGILFKVTSVSCFSNTTHINRYRKWFQIANYISYKTDINALQADPLWSIIRLFSYLRFLHLEQSSPTENALLENISYILNQKRLDSCSYSRCLSSTSFRWITPRHPNIFLKAPSNINLPLTYFQMNIHRHPWCFSI